MSEEIQRPRAIYYPGDEIRMRLTFVHEANIAAVEVVYAANADPSYTLSLSGDPEPHPGSDTTGERKQSVVDVSAVVDVADTMQYYTVRRVVFYTVSGRLFIEDTDLEHWPLLELRDERRPPWALTVELQPENDEEL